MLDVSRRVSLTLTGGVTLDPMYFTPPVPLPFFSPFLLRIVFLTSTLFPNANGRNVLCTSVSKFDLILDPIQ
jgi:hypothetical protein